MVFVDYSKRVWETISDYISPLLRIEGFSRSEISPHSTQIRLRIVNDSPFVIRGFRATVESIDLIDPYYTQCADQLSQFISTPFEAENLPDRDILGHMGASLLLLTYHTNGKVLTAGDRFSFQICAARIRVAIGAQNARTVKGTYLIDRDPNTKALVFRPI